MTCVRAYLRLLILSLKIGKGFTNSDKVDFEKNQQATKKHEKFPSRQRVKDKGTILT